MNKVFLSIITLLSISCSPIVIEEGLPTYGKLPKTVARLPKSLNYGRVYFGGGEYNCAEPTDYNWQPLALRITEGCDTKYQQAYMLYVFCCRNFRYKDLNKGYGPEHQSDPSLKTQLTVCQGISEIYYRLASSIGLNVVCETGAAGNWLSHGPHMWNIVYGTEKGTVYVDNCWGMQTYRAKHRLDMYFTTDAEEFYRNRYKGL